MTQSVQFVLGSETGFGTRLKQAREAAGLSVEDVAQRLRMPGRVVRSLESADGAAPDATIFVRGQLRSYARLLDVPFPATTVAANEVPPPAELISYSHTPRYRRLAEQAARRAVYIVLTVALVAPVWLYTRPHLAGSLAPVHSLDDLPAAVSMDPVAQVRSAQQPMVASLASLPDAAPASPKRITLRFKGDSWVEVFSAGPQGQLLERGLLTAGQSRTFDSAGLGRVLLGNSTAVEVSRAGERIDLAPFSRANVARFTLSSDGSLAPVID